MANQPEHARSAFWTRGPPPLAAAVAPIPPPVEIVKSWGIFVGGQVVRGGRCGLDGSGGIYASDWRLRR
eukprot:7731810-Pyramimonas_sp.AAC.1